MRNTTSPEGDLRTSAMVEGRIPIKAAVFGRNAMTLILEEDVGDFWMRLGPCWGLFRNQERILNERINTKEATFLLVDTRPVCASTPHPVVSSSNVLWRKREALEAVEQELVYYSGFGDCAQCTSQEL